MAEKSRLNITKDITHEIGAANRERALQAYTDNLPYNKERVIGESEFFLRHIAAAKFEMGKRLLILKEFESVRTFAQILRNNFKGMSKRSAYEYIAFAKKCIDLPKLKSFGEENWSKVLTLLNSCTDEQIKEIEKHGIGGKVLDEYDGLSVREFKTLLKQYKKDAEKVIGKQISKLEAKLADSEDKLKSIQLQQTNIPGHFQKDWNRALKLIDKGIEILTDLHSGDEAEGRAEMIKEFKKKIKRLDGQFDGCISMLEKMLNTRSIPDE